ncbi:MAG: hypothetical protein LBH56_01720 [Coriobacteriales bacterium]|jgi:hypothetical protein|nr:hypothetical protein [Coriobacteriales bacterium]
MTESSENRERGGAGFIITWTIVIMLGLAVEFLGRFFGYANNPLAMFHPVVPAFTGILAAIIVVSGCLMLTGKGAKQQSMTRRTSVLLIALGASMLLAFFLFKQVMPLIFG